MVTLMDDQNEAWRRLTEARLKTLEAAVQTRPIRRRRDGRPLPAIRYEPGDRKPLTQWLEMRVQAIELLLRLMLDADQTRADELDLENLEEMIEAQLDRMEIWSRVQLEPDSERRQTMAMIFQAQIILLESYTWPLAELEERGL